MIYVSPKATPSTARSDPFTVWHTDTSTHTHARATHEVWPARNVRETEYIKTECTSHARYLRSTDIQSRAREASTTHTGAARTEESTPTCSTLVQKSGQAYYSILLPPPLRYRGPPRTHWRWFSLPSLSSARRFSLYISGTRTLPTDFCVRANCVSTHSSVAASSLPKTILKPASAPSTCSFTIAYELVDTRTHATAPKHLGVYKLSLWFCDLWESVSTSTATRQAMGERENSYREIPKWRCYVFVFFSFLSARSRLRGKRWGAEHLAFIAHTYATHHVSE